MAELSRFLLVTKRNRHEYRASEVRAGFVFIAPIVAWYLLVMIWPIFYGFFLSFTDYNILTPPRWVGLKNYSSLLRDEVFQVSLGNTFRFVAMSVGIGVPFSLLIALALNGTRRWTAFFRASYFMPVITSTAAVAIIWKWLYTPTFGLFNSILTWFGLPKQPFITSTSQALPCAAVMYIWKTFGYNAVIFLAGLKGIPQTYYEAAKIDGATTWQLFRYVTLPLLMNTTVFVLITSVIGTFQVFTEVYVLTGGGPVDSTRLLVLYMRDTAFTYLRMGSGSAMAFVMFLIVMVFTAMQFRIFRSGVEY